MSIVCYFKLLQVYDPLLYNLELMQDVCVKLAEEHKGRLGII